MTSTPLLSKSSRHETLTRNIRERIANGEWGPGERLPSFAQLRAEYGVAPTTIDRIYAVLEQEGLVVREQGRGVFVAQRRPTLKGILGLVVPDAHSPRHFPYWVHLLHGIQSVAHTAGYQVLMLAADMLPWEKMDGILVHGDRVDELLQQRPVAMPAVSLMVPTTLAPSVVADDIGGTREMVEKLLSLGHRNIGTLMFNGTRLPERRLTGYYAALGASGVPIQLSLVRPLRNSMQNNTLRQLGRFSMQKWLEDGWYETGCTAILVQNDRIALGVMDALAEAGIKVPEQVSVVGFDGAEECEEFSPNLTSVGVPLFEVGAVATKLLLDQITGVDVKPQVITLPAQIQLRETTAPVSG